MNDDRALSELQHWLAEVFRRRTALPSDPELCRLAREHATGNDRLSPVEQLEIYREQFWLRHTSSLVEDFPGLGGILGQADWERLVEEFLLAHPPSAPSLRELGRALPAFVAAREWLPERELCADMARLEWAYLEAFDAADAPPLDPSALGAIPEDAWEHARIDLAASISLLDLRYPVADLRRQLRRAQGPVAIPEPSPTPLVVYRNRDRELYDRRVSPGALALLSALARRTPLGAACETAVSAAPEQAREIDDKLADWFRDWAALGWIARVRLADRP